MIRSCIRQMYERDLVMPLLILLSHAKDRLSMGHCEEENESRYPIVADLIDRCNDCFVQLYDFLETFESLLNKGKRLGDVLPSLMELITKYNMSPEFAFHICRSYFGDTRICGTRKKDVIDLTTGDKNNSAKEQLVATCKLLLSKDSLESMTPEFYTSFWAYKTSDIYSPIIQYT
eukprot:UN31717